MEKSSTNPFPPKYLELHERICATMQLIRAGFFDLIELLNEFRDGEHYFVFGYNTMREYIQSVSGYKDRMSFHIQKLIENRALSEYIAQHREEAEQIGQSKLIALAESAQVTGENIYEMTDMAMRSNTVRDLQDRLGGGTGEHPVQMQIQFLTREDWEFVRDAIERVGKHTGTENNGRIVMMAFQEVMSSHPEWFVEGD